ncbi:MAG: type II toxin-antitoxin system VapC family toxin [Sphingomonas sp.]|uniref:type II toxin-antitoxin system VapC family toxin n=1 Tax=Sphingomonas sp. TaxID=28214 RepID=UPI0017CA900A|nr:type II toxin-antitoxin system VapC family toxin [Sphingomonas sp.]MBA3668200.1 type II toxin-antitoxin system VapC family toxin [Sphingomonas sp.]
MTRFLLDTNILSELARNPSGRAARRAEVHKGSCITSAIVVAEIRFGLAKRGSAELAKRITPVLESIPAIGWEHPADHHYAQLRTSLEAAGTPIGGNDMLIAAHALALEATLVTANEREFRRVPGLSVENWQT